LHLQVRHSNKWENQAVNDYNDSKKARRVTAVIYLLIMAVVMGGTYLSEQKKAAAKVAQNLPVR
jgi:hypothetical protein